MRACSRSAWRRTRSEPSCAAFEAERNGTRRCYLDLVFLLRQRRGRRKVGDSATRARRRTSLPALPDARQRAGRRRRAEVEARAGEGGSGDGRSQEREDETTSTNGYTSLSTIQHRSRKEGRKGWTTSALTKPAKGKPQRRVCHRACVELLGRPAWGGPPSTVDQLAQ